MSGELALFEIKVCLSISCAVWNLEKFETGTLDKNFKPPISFFSSDSIKYLAKNVSLGIVGNRHHEKSVVHLAVLTHNHNPTKSPQSHFRVLSHSLVSLSLLKPLLEKMAVAHNSQVN